MALICKFLSFSLLYRLITSINFPNIDIFKPKLYPSPCFFITEAWSSFFKNYFSVWGLNIWCPFDTILFLGCKELEAHILFLSWLFSLLEPKKIDIKLTNQLVVSFISPVLISSSFVVSPIGPVCKSRVGFQKIFHFSLLLNFFVNDFIV